MIGRHTFSSRVRLVGLGAVAVALVGAGALALPAFASSAGASSTPTGGATTSADGSTTAHPRPVPSPTGVVARFTPAQGTLVDTSTVPVRCTAGPSGVLTFAANDDGAIGHLTATGDTVCAPNPADVAYITHVTPTVDNAYSLFGWAPTADVAWEGTSQTAAGCLFVYGGSNTPNDIGNGELTGSIAIDATGPGRYLELFGPGCALHVASL